jgi:hypothetical protein
MGYFPMAFHPAFTGPVGISTAIGGKFGAGAERPALAYLVN